MQDLGQQYVSYCCSSVPPNIMFPQIMAFWQLVCFYYILTTFTTVGYGGYSLFNVDLHVFCMNWNDYWGRWYLCIVWRRESKLRFTNSSDWDEVTCCIFSLGVLHLSLPMCSIAFWNHHCSSERDSCWSYNEEKGSWQDLRILPGLEPKVSSLTLLAEVIRLLRDNFKCISTVEVGSKFVCVTNKKNWTHGFHSTFCFWFLQTGSAHHFSS